MTTTPGDANGVAVTPTDSGPGPLDVLEARITLDHRRALDSAANYLGRMREVLDNTTGRHPLDLAHELGRLLSRYEYESTLAQALGGLTTDANAL